MASKTRKRKVRFSRRLIMGGSKCLSSLVKEGGKGPVVVQNPLVKIPPAAGLGLSSSPPKKGKKHVKHKKPGTKKLKA